jgi:heme exporter protein C
MDQPRFKHLDAVLGVLLLFAMILALYMAFIQAPRAKDTPDMRTLGDLQRVFYFHVPSGMMGLTAFAVNFIASLTYLIKRNRKWDSLALSAAEVGVMFFTIVLVTGSIWAKPVWLAWWTWQPRLTSSLVLWILYLAYMLLRGYISDPERKAIMSSVFAIIAFLDAPIVWFSIRWAATNPKWRGLHPNAMIETGKLDPAMWPAFLTCIVAFVILLIYLIRRRFFLEMARLEGERLERIADLSR